MSMYNNLRVLSVMLRKGGVGKTLLATLIAEYFGSFTNKRVLLLDMDTQQNASCALIDMEKIPDSKAFCPPVNPDFDPNDPDMEWWGGRSSTADLFWGKPVIPYPTEFPNLDVLPSEAARLQDVEFVRKEEVREKIYDHMRNFFMMEEVQAAYDLVVIDTPPGEGAINRSVLRSCTDVLLPVVPEEKPIQGLFYMLELIGEENSYREQPINLLGIVPNMVDGRYAHHAKNIESLHKDPAIGKYMAPFVLHRYSAFSAIDAPGVKPENVWGFSGNNDARKAAESLCKFVEERMYG